MQALRLKVNEASGKDPSEFAVAEGCINIMEQGEKEIDYIFDKLKK